jgi:hypothetical protein
MVFLVLASLALILTLLWLWQSVRLALVHAMAPPLKTIVSAERGALLAEKQSLLIALKDLEAERDSGKLSNDDFVQLNAQYRSRAVEVLRELDALLAPHRAAAKSLIATAASGGDVATLDSPEAPAADSGKDEVSAAAAIVVCPSCQTANDRDALFCKKCGARMASEVVA